MVILDENSYLWKWISWFKKWIKLAEDMTWRTAVKNIVDQTFKWEKINKDDIINTSMWVVWTKLKWWKVIYESIKDTAKKYIPKFFNKGWKATEEWAKVTWDYIKEFKAFKEKLWKNPTKEEAANFKKGFKEKYKWNKTETKVEGKDIPKKEPSVEEMMWDKKINKLEGDSKLWKLAIKGKDFIKKHPVATTVTWVVWWTIYWLSWDWDTNKVATPTNWTWSTNPVATPTNWTWSTNPVATPTNWTWSTPKTNIKDTTNKKDINNPTDNSLLSMVTDKWTQTKFNTKTSIRDNLVSKWINWSYDYRSLIAWKLWIKDYRWTAQQNINMLKILWDKSKDEIISIIK